MQTVPAEVHAPLVIGELLERVDESKETDAKIEVASERMSKGRHLYTRRMENGAYGIRTHDLLHAMQALSQLS